MPPRLAALLTILLIIYLFWMDRKNNEGFSKAIWIPFTWLFFTQSRNISEWLDLSTPDMSASANAMLEGNPLNRNIYTVLIIAGIIVLLKRKLDWRTIFIKNSWVWLYLIFGILSFAWSDYPFVSLKRWIKSSGALIMALIVVTEARPYIAIGVILKRLAFILLPLSVLFIKYYPELGRMYHMGQPLYTGVAGGKNGLGAICLVAGIYFSWNLLLGRKIKDETISQSLHYSIYLIIIPMIVWLFYMANSSTSLACIIFAIFLFLIARQPVFARDPHKIVIFGATGAVLFGIMELAFGIKYIIFAMLGRRPDLTNRTEIWEFLLEMVQNPVIGAGYESFWLGERLNVIQQRFGGIVQAHSGYLEMYLNMGIIGVIFIICWIASGLISVIRHLNTDYPAAVLRLCFIVVVALYNYTEAVFYGVSTLWILFFIGILTIPGQSMPNEQHN
jgi:O-antigen ligase